MHFKNQLNLLSRIGIVQLLENATESQNFRCPLASVEDLTVSDGLVSAMKYYHCCWDIFSSYGSGHAANIKRIVDPNFWNHQQIYLLVPNTKENFILKFHKTIPPCFACVMESEQHLDW